MSIRSIDVPAGAVVPYEFDGAEYVVWRDRSGTLGAVARTCPHLDWDLAEGYIDGDELVCAGHGWSFDRFGRACKRNLAGRADPKDDVVALTLVEVDGEVRPAR